MIGDDFRAALENLDLPRLKAIWKQFYKHLPQPQNDDEALKWAHMARTQSKKVAEAKRLYSHKWLRERSLPSLLPDELKQSFEKVYPTVVTSVGVMVMSNVPEIKTGITNAMNHVIGDLYADGVTDPRILKPRMLEAREKERQALGLNRRKLVFGESFTR